MTANRVIGVDLGGTKVLAGVMDDNGEVLDTVERPTVTTSQQALLDELADVVRSLPQEGVRGVGFGIPTRVDVETGRAVGAAVNIPVRDVPFRAEMQKRLGLPVEFENDASCATLAEFVFGAGRGTRDLVMLTLGTGVGGGAVSHGRLFRAWTEFGHMVIVADGEPCHGACSGRGHVEAYCSGRALDIRARELLGPGATARDLVRESHPILVETGHYLGIAIGSLINIFGATRVVIGGGFGVAAFDQMVAPARLAVLREALSPAGQSLEIARAELPAAGVIGAGLLAFEAS
jgi:glucokinase